MASLRRLLYKAGLRPKLGSIWHSPTLHIRASFEEAVKGLKGPMVLGDTVRIEEMLKRTEDEIALLHVTKFCPFCGQRLKMLLLTHKECPEGCCTAFVIDNAEGLPVLSFER